MLRDSRKKSEILIAACLALGLALPEAALSAPPASGSKLEHRWVDLKENGSAQEAQRSWSTAERYYLQAQAVARRIGPESNQLLETEARLANVRLLGGKEQLAEEGYKTVIELLKKKKKDKTLHQETMIWVEDLADTYVAKAGNRADDRSLNYVNHAVKIRDVISGDKHPRMSATLQHLCNIYQMRHDWGALDRTAQRLLKVDELRFGRDHDRVAQDLYCIASAKYSQGLHADAESYVRQALDIYLKKERPPALAIALSKTQLAHILRSQKQYKLAEEEARSALAWMERELGKNSYNANHNRELLASILLDEGKTSEAVAQYETSLAIAEKALGKGNRELIPYMERLKSAYTRQKARGKVKEIDSRIRALGGKVK
ncbi:MAG: tetratricopeptide repeat protein [Cyanobacteria bacterium HKST-UBA02]|nr:tetratricopeptide repeat protein [Cyanobacteria bacterium HKST-UBA02]